ncbi:MAG: undecaprenyl-phosphate glucose phosphotransferase [Planctomycetes bacterium GWF2_50_10]|nr:MAG: undecaprenyl-phosphate glucose phosphotransferase [Planctomycetes bacterium GWF2_50_10]
MLKRHASFFVFFKSILDLAIIAGIWMLTYFIRFKMGLIPAPKGVVGFERHLMLTVPVCLLVFGSCVWSGLYQAKRMQNFFWQFLDIVKACFVAALLVLTLLYYTQEVMYSRKLLVIFFPLLCVGLTSAHLGTMIFLHSLRKRGRNLRYCAIIGAGKRGQQLLRDLGKLPWLGMRCCYFIDSKVERAGSSIRGVPVYGPISRMPEILAEQPVDEIYLALSGDDALAAYPTLEKLQARGVTIRITPDWGNLTSTHTTVMPIGSQLLFCAADSPLGGYMVILKEVFDRLAALLLLVASFIPMLVIAVLVKITSDGPIFYKQVRVGMNQRQFNIYKFRTMRVDSDTNSSPKWTVLGDDRCTGLGRLLRKSSLDELPQLFNVLIGDMSLVGPRPERPVFVNQFSEEFKDYMLRHRVKSGITGWAQIHGYRGDTSLKKRIQYDLFYVRNWSFGIDIWILLLTPLHVFKGKNAY